MKVKKLFIGMFVCIFAAGTIVATSGNFTISKRTFNKSDDKGKVAQVAKSASEHIVELGPDNVAGRVRGLIYDNQDSTNQTLYAGGVAGGFFKTTDGGQHWQRVPMRLANGTDVNLPISCMVQTSDGVIYIGTGEGFLQSGQNNGISATVGRGLYRFVDENNYSLVPATAPVSDTISDNTADWAYINRLAAAEYNNVLYFYAATNTGLYRWKIQSASDWNNAPTKVFSGKVVDIDVSYHKTILYFTTKNTIYKISNILSDNQTPVEISRNYLDTVNIGRIEVAVAPSDENFVYAVVADTNGLSKGVYLTRNQQVWNIITTSTVNLFSRSNKGTLNNTITVFPDNPQKVVVGGNALWVGEGFDGATLYTWTKSAYTESDLNAGNYMGQVYTSSLFVHSGIHEIIFPNYFNTSSDYKTFYIATDGGVFSTVNGGNSYTMHNKGLNTTQFYSIAIANDASVLGGAQDNSVPYIASRNASDSGDLNTTAQIIWNGNGGGVAASMFQMTKPISRRCLFVSSEGSAVGRTYADYSDFTNNQTWSYGVEFTGGKFSNGPDVPPILLWETVNDHSLKDSVTFTIDTNSWVKRGNDILYVRNPDLSSEDRLNFTIQAGDTILVRSRGHFDYPFEYVFPNTFVAKDQLRHTVKNPIQNRLFVGASHSGNKIYMTPNSTDFTKSRLLWYELISFGASVPHALAISNDGNCLYIAIDDAEGGSRIVRINNLLEANDAQDLQYEPPYMGQPGRYKVVVDTMFFGDSNKIGRKITSLAVDPRQGQDNLVVTCGDFVNAPNLYYITNASTNNYSITPKVAVKQSMPLYSSLVEMTTGNVYVGSENGLYISSNIASANPTWTMHGNFFGTPVFAIKQQTNKMQFKQTTYFSGANEELYSWGKTKYPGAIYYATYGSGLYMDKQYITDTVNEISIDDVKPVANANSIKVYPNPAANFANIDFTVGDNTNVDIQLFDMSGRVVFTKSLGKVSAGTHSQIIPCENLNKGVYVVRVAAGTQPMTSKLVVK
ncbi:MAG: T9SS type A sorting domain-containing protein [Bacteroidales bacterium]|nr:T9SS type A sorting domain-containing protein [Bacteroidales bacterium]